MKFSAFVVIFAGIIVFLCAHTIDQLQDRIDKNLDALAKISQDLNGRNNCQNIYQDIYECRKEFTRITEDLYKNPDLDTVAAAIEKQEKEVAGLDFSVALLLQFPNMPEVPEGTSDTEKSKDPKLKKEKEEAKKAKKEEAKKAKEKAKSSPKSALGKKSTPKSASATSASVGIVPAIAIMVVAVFLWWSRV